MQKHCQHSKDEWTQFFRKIYLWLYSKGLQKGLCVRGELETEQRQQHIDPTLLAIAAFFYRSPGLLNRGPGGPASAGSWLSVLELEQLTSHSDLQLTDFLPHPGYIIIIVASQFALNSTCCQSRVSTDIFDRMHLLFTQAHFSSDSPAGWEVNMLHSCKF